MPVATLAEPFPSWVCDVLQAFAKQHGSYDAISGGHVCEAFEALTGAPTETIMLGAIGLLLCICSFTDKTWFVSRLMSHFVPPSLFLVVVCLPSSLVFVCFRLL